MNNHWVC